MNPCSEKYPFPMTPASYLVAQGWSSPCPSLTLNAAALGMGRGTIPPPELTLAGLEMGTASLRLIPAPLPVPEGSAVQTTRSLPEQGICSRPANSPGIYREKRRIMPIRRQPQSRRASALWLGPWAPKPGPAWFVAPAGAAPRLREGCGGAGRRWAEESARAERGGEAAASAPAGLEGGSS